MKKVIYGLIIIILIPSFVPAQSNRTFADPTHWIPPDFNPNTYTLLIAKYPLREKDEKRMEEFISKVYPWPCEIVDTAEIKSNPTKYSDSAKYKYAFLWTLKNWYGERYDVDPNGFFYDRTNQKAYPTTKKINNYGDKSYMPFFNTIVKYFKHN